MATKINSVRGTHVSPGVYTKETVLRFASKALGLTSLGAVGETLKGPAFQATDVSNWGEYVKYFGGTSTAKYKASQYPKYELPYIAQSYLTASEQMKVVRVLGLSGTNAGPAWIIKAVTEDANSPYNNMVVAVLRSRGEHKKAMLVKSMNPDATGPEKCKDIYDYDGIDFFAKEVYISPSLSIGLEGECEKALKMSQAEDAQSTFIPCTPIDYGTFTLTVTTGFYTSNEDGTKKPIQKSFDVSLNPGDKNYIYNVIGGSPDDGDTEIYVEELYDVALMSLVNNGIIKGLAIPNGDAGDGHNDIKGLLDTFTNRRLLPKFAPINGLLAEEPNQLTRRDVGKRFLFTEDSVTREGSAIAVRQLGEDGTWEDATGVVGAIYTVKTQLKPNSTREYFYGTEMGDNGQPSEVLAKQSERYLYNEQEQALTEGGNLVQNPEYVYFYDCVESLADGLFYMMGNDENGDYVCPVSLDLNNYRESYRCSSTPWVLSELKGTGANVELTKLFRFHTISDGTNSTAEVKVSIENINPSYGTFDVLVRDFNDSDTSKVVLERYKACDLVPGSANYIALKIGSFDGSYESKSNYITVEVNETDRTKVSIPAGFMGYPVRDWNGCYPTIKGETSKEITPPYFQYNTTVDSTLRPNKQYFGISDLVGIDIDVLNYKGVEAYNEIPSGLTPCFHLDSRLSVNTAANLEQSVRIDGVEGYTWSTVSPNVTVGNMNIEPRIGTEVEMADSIYEDIRYRKFTLAFYGGFDGWDYYRTSRSNSDDFTYAKYRGTINPLTGLGSSVNILRSPEKFGFADTDKCLNSDYYAYLYGVNCLSNPSETDINVLVTPGIDYVNNKMLVDSVIDVVEEERADCVYIVTTPDKPFGAGDSESEMYSPQDVVDNLDDSEIDSNYVATFYPFVKYYDADNEQYIYLPPTRDVVRNLAYTDNTRYPWFVAAGYDRGTLMGAVRPKKVLKLADTDILYEGRINYINTFSKEGMRLWGDKNLQREDDVMNRLSKRRLMNRIRQLISATCVQLIFEPNDATIAKQFRSAITAIMDDIMSKRGIVNWKLEIDDSQEARDRMELPAALYVQPLKALEYISISFNITANGAVFED